MCNVCSQDWEGDDCSTARLTRPHNSSNSHAAVGSSGIISFDGATYELVAPGAFRLLEMSDLYLDGYFVV